MLERWNNKIADITTKYPYDIISCNDTGFSAVMVMQGSDANIFLYQIFMYDDGEFEESEISLNADQIITLISKLAQTQFDQPKKNTTNLEQNERINLLEVKLTTNISYLADRIDLVSKVQDNYVKQISEAILKAERNTTLCFNQIACQDKVIGDLAEEINLLRKKLHTTNNPICDDGS
ncbi:MAG: hypothetical protein AB1782_10740 [Cyanobacteriota bacterium]